MKIKYPVEHAVSVWIGSFLTENDFDKSIDTVVTPQLSLDIPIDSICEISFEPKLVSIRSLIEGFSGWTSFVDQAEASAKSLGYTEANAALVCYYLRCDGAPSLWGELKFLGTFIGQDVF